VAPCLHDDPCGLDSKISYEDGTSAIVREEIPRLAAVLRDNATINQDGQTICREELGSEYALLAAMAAEIAVVGDLKPGEAVATDWRPAAVVSFETCTPTTRDRLTVEHDLGSLLTHARETLVRAQHDVTDKDWADARLAGDELMTLGIQISRLSARDDPGTAVPAWAPVRALGWDLIELSGRLGVPRLAANSASGTLISDSIKTIRSSPLAAA
jgi:hypothetical protein